MRNLYYGELVAAYAFEKKAFANWTEKAGNEKRKRTKTNEKTLRLQRFC